MPWRVCASQGLDQFSSEKNVTVCVNGDHIKALHGYTTTDIDTGLV